MNKPYLASFLVNMNGGNVTFGAMIVWARSNEEALGAVYTKIKGQYPDPSYTHYAKAQELSLENTTKIKELP